MVWGVEPKIEDLTEGFVFRLQHNVSCGLSIQGVRLKDGGLGFRMKISDARAS